MYDKWHRYIPISRSGELKISNYIIQMTINTKPFKINLLAIILITFYKLYQLNL